MATANELIMIFIGLEISSIASYILAGYLRDDARNNESALKYFLLGSFATAFLLYGVAWIYGITGSTNLIEIRRALISGGAPSLALTGAAAALMFVGFGFKISAAPFQIWAPDVYQGAPAPVSAFLSVGPKAAAFAILMRVFLTAFGPIADRWEPIVWVCALATMIVGNFAAIQQSNIKRMLAYSSIAHAGYVLVAVTAQFRHRVGGRDVLSGGVRVHQYRRLRRGDLLRPQGREVRQHRRFRRPRAAPAGDGRDADHLPAEPDRRAAHRRILRQVLHLQSGAGCRTWCG